MNSLEQNITSLVRQAVKSLYDLDVSDAQVQLQKTRPEFEGNITLVVFPFVKAARKAPAQVAAEIGDKLTVDGSGLIAKYNAVQGFLNLTISDAFWIEQLKAIDAEENYGRFNRPSNAPSHEGRDGEGLLSSSLPSSAENQANNWFASQWSETTSS